MELMDKSTSQVAKTDLSGIYPDFDLNNEQRQELKIKLKEIDEKYQKWLKELRERSMNVVRDYLKKADNYAASKIAQKLKGLYGR